MINKDDLQKIHILGQRERIGAVEPASTDVQFVGVDGAYDDEISLLDLWLVLAKRRYLLFAIVLVFLAAGITGALMKPIVYGYSAVLQIGIMGAVTGGDKGSAFIDSPDNVITKLTKSYIPLATAQFLQANPELKSAPKITAIMQKKSDLIVLETKGEEINSKEYLDVIKGIVGLIQKDHQPQMDIVRNALERNLMNAKMELAQLENPLTLQLKQKKFEMQFLNSNLKIQNLKDQRLMAVAKQDLITQKKDHSNELLSLSDNLKVMKSDISRLNDVDRLLEKRAADLSNTIQNELKNRKLAVSSISTGPEAMTVLLLDNQIQANHDKLAKIEERLSIQQPNLREKLNNKIKANSRSQSYHKKLITDIDGKLQKIDIDNNQALQKAAIGQSSLELNKAKMLINHKNSLLVQQQKIDAISYKLKGLRDTQTLTLPMQSLQPVGTGKKLIVIVALIAGLFIGIFCVFFLEFLSKVKEKQKEQVES